MATSKIPSTTDYSEKKSDPTTLSKRREAAATARSRARKGAPALVANERTPDLRVDLAHVKPDWDKQRSIAERPLWEVAALAMNLDPVAEGAKARRGLDPVWNAAYVSLVRTMCDALSPKLGIGIHYDDSKPVNTTRVLNKKDLKFVRVNAASATAFVLRECNLPALPPGFLSLQEYLAQQVTVTNDVRTHAQIASPLASQKKDQEKANETKASNILAALLYVVVEQEMGGWAGADTVQRENLIKKILKHLDCHSIQSKRGMSAEAIEGMLDKGMGIAPLR